MASMLVLLRVLSCPDTTRAKAAMPQQAVPLPPPVAQLLPMLLRTTRQMLLPELLPGPQQQPGPQTV